MADVGSGLDAICIQRRIGAGIVIGTAAGWVPVASRVLPFVYGGRVAELTAGGITGDAAAACLLFGAPLPPTLAGWIHRRRKTFQTATQAYCRAMSAII